MALLCENPYKDNAPRCTLMIQDQKGAVASYNNALVKISTFDGLLNITVEDGADSWVRHDSKAALDMASRERDKLKAEITDLQGRNDWQVGKIRQLDRELDEVRGDLQAMQASLDFSLETNERLKAEALLAQAKLAESRRTWVADWDIANNRAIKAEAELTKVRIERDGARRDFLRATESHKWKYAADLEARIESVVVTLEEAMTSGGNWVHVNQALKIAKGKL